MTVRISRLTLASLVALVALPIWIVAAGSVLSAPPAASAQEGGEPPCTDTDADGNADNDGDGLCDNWEDAGIDVDADGTVDLQLYDENDDGTLSAAERPSKNHKDLYEELDFMTEHRPDADALNDVVLAFANAPVTNPDGTPGIRLHNQVDETLPETELVQFSSNCPRTASPVAGAVDFCALRAERFGTSAERTRGAKVVMAKQFMSRYGLYAHKLTGGALGIADFAGPNYKGGTSSLVVAGGSMTEVGGHAVGTRNQQSGTYMHELGHNLAIDHGGADAVNCKPNYLSVLSYTQQVENVPVLNRGLDYSRQGLPTLDENSLSEPAGIGGAPGSMTTYGPDPVRTSAGDVPIDWNRNGQATDEGVAADINNNPAFGDCRESPGQTHTGSADWPNLKYRTDRNTPATAAESRATHQDVTTPELRAASPDSDGDGDLNFDDDCVFVSNPNQVDGDGDGIGDACESNQPPSVSAGPDVRSGAGSAAPLEGSVSDADPSDLDTLWSYLPGSGLPPDARCAIADPGALRTTISCALPGRYTVRLTATDGVTDAVSATATVTVDPPSGGSTTGGPTGGTTTTTTGGTTTTTSGGSATTGASPTGTTRGPVVRFSTRVSARASATRRGRAVQFSVSGGVRRPAGIPCGGRVSLRVRAGRRTVASRLARVDARSCRYAARFSVSRSRFGRASTVNMLVRFTGTPTLRPAGGPTVFIRLPPR